MKGNNGLGNCVYVLYIRDHDVCKIGISYNFEQRLRDWNYAIPFEEIETLAVHRLHNSSSLESALHERFDQERLENSEWFSLSESQRTWLQQDTLNICRELGVAMDALPEKRDQTEAPLTDNESNQDQLEERYPALKAVRQCRDVITELAALHGELGSWNAVGEEKGISGAMAYRIVNENYQPRDPGVRAHLGLPEITKTLTAQLAEYVVAEANGELEPSSSR